MGKYIIEYKTFDGIRDMSLIAKNINDAELVFNRITNGSEECVINIEGIYEIVNDKKSCHKSYENKYEYK